ncbi:glycoside hydrolase family 92 protein [Seonamhaeicola sediminis]|uniref:Glycoside hydrolase family 92 protein n=1 Tax=Seonamhaeicola sediminis TaxID=2528206 RepID=A0A562YIV0_9FLAO|nr:GH92 family glycosyl hydrolase [Seonamhaeicola sediminis]TWO34698.1 glycoside hydrolase family 92 protein [Seonamhaeicola sediminis]
MNKIYIYILLLLIISFSCQPKTDEKENTRPLVDYVNLFIGTDGPGNTYPGASEPFGMVQLSPDIGIPGWDRIAGYFYQDSIITGFSHTHLSGTGAGDLYDILVMPTNGRFSKRIEANNFKPYSTFSHKNEKAFPGYYSVDLLDYGIRAELTATKRVGIHRYTFPKDGDTQIHIDLGYALNWDKPTETYIEKVNDSTIQGYRMSTGWARNQKVYFQMQFSKPFDTHHYYKNDTLKIYPMKGNTKMVLKYQTLENDQIIIKTGLSSTSCEAAAHAIKMETVGFDFDYQQEKTTLVWENQLQKIKIETPDEDKKSIFYTMMYQNMLTPNLFSDYGGTYKTANDENGQLKKGINPISKAEGFNRYDTFSLWDTFRAAHPLHTILQPNLVPYFIKSLLAHYNETGELPVWSMQGSETNMMIGYHAVPVIVDAYFKGFEFDAELAFKACKESAMVSDRQIDIYMEKGYIPVDKHHENWSVSRTMEYAYDDWCIAMFARSLGKLEDYNYFLQRSKNWQNLYNDKNTWFQPKNKDGNFIEPFTPKNYSPYFCESNAWHYYWFVPHDLETLVKKTGGTERFEQKLDSMFSYYPEPTDKLPLFSTGMIGQYAHGNEPSHHVAYLYNFIDKPWKAQKYIRQILETQYKNEPNGHCGNEDCGQMSAWYIFNALGFYPVNPAQNAYALGSPLFDSASIALPDNKRFNIIVQNNSKDNIYVKSIWLNDELLDRDYITHKEILAGGTLKFEMSNTPSVNKIAEKLNSAKVYSYFP